MSHIYGIDRVAAELASESASLAREVLLRYAADVDSNARFPDESLRALAARGYLGLCISKDLGGKGEGPAAFCAVVEELAQGCASTSMVFVMHIAAAQAIAASSTLHGREELLGQIAAGKHLTTLAFSERGSRSQFWAPVSKLAPNSDGYTTTAYKSWVTAAGHANSYVSTAQKPGAVSPLESTVYLARNGARGVSVAGAFNGLGLRGNESAPVVMENIAVHHGDLLTAPGEGPKIILEVVLPWFAVGTAAMANGLCRAAVAATARHLRDAGFEHTGTRLRDLPTLRARLAEMSARTDQARALLAHALREMQDGSATAPLLVLEARLAALQAAVDVTDLAMKACGGAAFSRHLPIERLFRDARAGWVMAPTADHLQEFIGRILAGLPLFE